MALVPTGKPVDRAERRSFADHVSLKGSRLSTRFFLSLFFFFSYFAQSVQHVATLVTDSPKLQRGRQSSTCAYLCSQLYTRVSLRKSRKVADWRFYIYKKGNPISSLSQSQQSGKRLPRIFKFQKLCTPHPPPPQFSSLVNLVWNYKKLKKNNNKRNNWTST